MIRRHLFTLSLVLTFFDAAGATALFLGLGELKYGDALWTDLWDAMGVHPWAGALLYGIAWVVVLWALGLYAYRVRWTNSAELNDLAVAAFIVGFLMMAFLFLARLDVSHSFLILLLVVQPLVALVVRTAVRRLFQRARRRGSASTYVLVVGTGETAQQFADALERHVGLGMHVIGHLRTPDDGDGILSRPILGAVGELPEFFHRLVVDEVAIASEDDMVDWVQAVIQLSGEEGKHVRLVSMPHPPTRVLPSEELDGLVIRSYVNGPARMLSLAIKRCVDIAGAAVGLVVLSPVFLAAALAILILDGHPIVFRQTRAGVHGRTFRMVKFRTMVPDAEARLEDVRKLNRIAGPAIQVDHDPRISRSGRFLRRTSIDELPQLWNVLKGEMSLIGPRPAPLVEVSGYDIWHRRRLTMRPGISGLAQVAIRTYESFDQRAELDLRYIDNWSPTLDLTILIRTFAVVFGASGR